MTILDTLAALKEGCFRVLKFIASDPVIFEGGLLDGFDADDDGDGSPNTVGTTCYHRHH